ncbi:hypothetical protein EBL_c29680 [Shimwellia blattae DSM 4481 = NBRC 105725]|uniref:Lipoprotein n=2 Tax=Shimwellia blattae TaxID=563 RepID=I2BBY4_SHIBC|nr:hypothetical protein [Shimwellia blattae]AFJ48038.1 hypothetical protein EBL_c29680 [Shimwellia blattae DSM 4481 = NBRC 105725]GAB81974.1 hypothetical protein EB105725_18_01030 [Shimwellia blattae DSM 4481 = NBRC 105725]VEC24881.1 Uncharacterised protein [Shimwellia blattae]
MKNRLLMVAVMVSCSATAEVLPLSEDSKFTPQGSVTTVSSGGVLQQVEQGTLNGVWYRFSFADGEGVFQGEEGQTADTTEGNWLLSCYQDNMTDKRSCSASKYDLTVTYYDNGASKVALGNNSFSGSRIYARIDGGEVMQGLGYGYFASNDSKTIINALLEGKTIRTRWQEWPYQSRVEGRVSGFGFAQVSRYMKWVLAGQPAPGG